MLAAPEPQQNTPALFFASIPRRICDYLFNDVMLDEQDGGAQEPVPQAEQFGNALGEDHGIFSRPAFSSTIWVRRRFPGRSRDQSKAALKARLAAAIDASTANGM
jgi:hypothetical protein